MQWNMYNQVNPMDQIQVSGIENKAGLGGQRPRHITCHVHTWKKKIQRHLGYDVQFGPPVDSCGLGIPLGPVPFFSTISMTSDGVSTCGSLTFPDKSERARNRTLCVYIVCVPIIIFKQSVTKGCTKIAKLCALSAKRMDEVWSWSEWKGDDCEGSAPLYTTVEMPCRFMRRW